MIDVSRTIHDTSIFITVPIQPLSESEGKRKEAQQWLDNVGKLVSQRDNNNIQFKSQIIESTSVINTIVDYAENQKIDLIVIGTRGQSGF